ncbi:muconate cycloisomerase family protein [Dactylosporangium fulvum]|uniref:Mandelate racemase/muconate lactonizing enzyme C-terminal domain-containing protein n=1 Tax=Dactylosporangium fulvum TaxID=53359 RepID=A0ABY5VT66_9ACTN|nr:enolase C-terminal domain-like protein [Dactylosporangium fulvum]UWP80284.1 hypothetical protein Dfulv_34695 [Dactylosporangium fulvum]
MKITKIDAIPLDARLKEPFKFGHVVRERSSNVLVRVETDEGLVGWGEACPVPQLTAETRESVVSVLSERVEPFLRGRDPRSWRTTVSLLDRRLVGFTFTRAALETALLDLTGKAAGSPIWAILGGRYRETLPLHGSVGWDERPEVMVETATRQAAEFDTLKLYVGPGELAADLDRLATARAALGPATALIIDVNGLWSRSEALRAGPRLAELGVRLVEQPLPARDPTGMREVTRIYGERYGIDVAADEGILSDVDAVYTAGTHAAAVATIGICKLGGPAAALDAARSALAHGLSAMVGSVVELGIAAAAGAHLAACVPQLAYPSYLMGPRKYAQQITGDGMPIRDGVLTVPNGPGLGIEIDLDAIDALDMRKRV